MWSQPMQKAVYPGDQAQLSGTSSTGIYSWSPALGLSDPSIANPVASPATTTIYTLMATGANGCSGTGSVTVTINPRATVLLRTDTTICDHASLSLTAQTTFASTFQWQPATGLSDPLVQTPIATPATTTVYTLTASNTFNCPASTSVTIAVKPSPTVVASDDVLICQGKSTFLQATGAPVLDWTSPNSLFHATGSAIPVHPGSSTKYYVRGTALNGCTATDSVTVAIHPIPVFDVFPDQGSICRNDTIRLTATGGDGYFWTATDGSSPDPAASILVNPSNSATYQVTITDNICQLSSTLTVPITVKELPSLSVTTSNDIDCTLGQTTVHATGARSWLWLTSQDLSDPLSANPIASPVKTTTYYVKGTGDNGCSSIDSIKVAVDFTSDLSQYPVPSAFSPNNDGNNDCFRLKYWGRINALEWEVFNRQGARVFFSKDPQQCWDGAYNGTPQPAGAYIYQIRATTPCGTAYRKGIVILVR